MNHREPPHLPVGVRRALHCLTLLLLPAMSPGGAQALTRPRSAPGGPEQGTGLPYLPALGAVPLRFQEAAPPPDLSTRPAAAAPPTPALSPTETSVALNNAAAAARTATPVPARDPAAVNAAPAPEAVPAKPAPAILPDDARPTVKPEDFLPYFQLPGAAKAPSDVTLIVPGARPANAAPAAPVIPPSSASYTQSPR